MKNQITYLLLAIFVLLQNPSLVAQQGNNWYFGFNAGVTFNTNPPSALSNSELYTNEGCASISDDYGNLLFYTDGSTIYNRHHQTMVNGDGLLGDFSATQSALLVQQPGNDSIYFVFTCPSGDIGLRGGYNYNIVNIKKNGGDGEVILKNQFMFGVATERLTAGRAANGKDVWIILKEFNSNKFLSYKLDCGGLNLNPVISVAGDPIFNTAGYMKISGDGSYLGIAIAGTIEPYVNIYKFDNNTGLISSPIHIPIKYATYGLEFSPDSKLLYATSYPDFDGIYQFSLATYDSAAIANSKLYYSLGKGVTGLQTGPDGKIYVARSGTKVLAAIQNPNTYGSGYNFQDSVIILSKECRGGLPNFMANQLVNQNTTITYSVNPDCSSVNFSGATSMQGMVNWFWDFGDGSTSGEQNPVHSFSGAANEFTVKLTVTPVAGCGTSYTTKIINLVRPLLNANFGIQNSCGNNSVSFKDSTVINRGTISNWFWDFGDGTTSNTQSPVHNFAGEGSYKVKLTVGYSQGCVVSDDTTKTFTIETKPEAGFITGKACVNNNVNFSDASSITTGSIITWRWIFGDGSSSALQNPSHLYAAAGNYDVQQIVSSNTGCTDTLLKKIIVEGKPVADFITGNICNNSPVFFTDRSIASNASITNWDWSFGDSKTDNNSNPAHLYNSYGDYTVQLQVGTDQGCVSDTLKRSIRVESVPTAGFTVQPACENNNLIVDNKSSIAFGAIESYYWDWGDGNYSQQQQPSFAYPAFGNYIIKQAVASKNGCISDTAYQTVAVETKPKVDFSFGNTCAGNPVVFNNLSINTSGAITSWKWGFGPNEGNSYLFEPTHTYNQFGKYLITVFASTANGCTSEESKVITIKKVEIFAGNDTTIAVNQPLRLNAAGAKDYQWLPNQYIDNNKSEHPVVILPNSFTYYLSGVTDEGCNGYDTINIKVYNGPEVYVPTAFSPNGDRKNDVFRPILPGIIELSHFSIYNRWGQLVFTTREIGKGWDGKLKGIDQPGGTFVWLLKAKTYLGTFIEKNGTVLLLR